MTAKNKSTRINTTTTEPGVDMHVITPDFAKRIVVSQGIGMPKGIGLAQVRTYGADMASVRWQPNGDAIIFDVNGKLVNGRKRLIASATYGVSFPTLVVSGIDPDATDYIDQHKRRSSKDALFIDGHDDASSVAAVAASIVNIARTGLPSQPLLSHGAMLRFVDQEKGVRQSAAEAEASPLAKYFSAPDLAALIHLTRKVDPKQSEAFFAGLQKALENRVPNSREPLQRLAATLQAINSEIEASGKSGSSRTRYYRVFYALSTWNAIHTGTPLTTLRIEKPGLEHAVRMSGLSEDIYSEYVASDEPDTTGGDRTGDYRAIVSEGAYSAGFEIITPEIALEMLLANGPLRNGEGRNRQRKDREVEALARDIVGDRFKITGQGIKISKTGRLLDGQHRLYACIRANRPFATLVVRGLEDDVFGTFDIGSQHNLGSILHERGETFGMTVASALRQLWSIREQGLRKGVTSKPTVSELLDLFEAAPDISEHAARARRSGFTNLKLAPSMTAALLTVLNGIDAVKAPVFFDKLETGANLNGDDPVLRLRAALTTAIGKRAGVGGLHRMIMIVMAWQATLAGKSLKLPKSLATLTAPAPFDRGLSPKDTLVLKDVVPSDPSVLARKRTRKPKSSTEQTATEVKEAPKSEDDGWIKVPLA